MEFQLPNIDGEELTIKKIQEAMEAGKLTRNRFCTSNM